MNAQNHKLPNDVSNRKGILKNLKARVAERLGSAYTVEEILDLTALMVEARIKDTASDKQYCARIYLVPEEKEDSVGALWSEHGAHLTDLAKLLSQQVLGLQKIGSCLAYLSGSPRGMDLATYLKQVGKCKPEFAVRATVQLITLLEKLEKKGCHHFRIKPSNIQLTREGDVFLKNVGLAPFEESLAIFLNVQGLESAAYLAPEQLKPGSQSTETDIYQLGLVLFRMVTGRLPFEGNYEKSKDGHLNQNMPNPLAINKEVGMGLARVLMVALAKEPSQRFGGLAGFKKALAMLHPAAERAVMLAADIKPLKERDLEKMHEQLAEAREKATQKDFDTALHDVEAVLMVAGPLKRAVQLHNQIRDAQNGPEIQKGLQQAKTCLQKRQVAGTLVAVNGVLALQPRNAHALRLQARIFDGVKQTLLDYQPAQHIQALLGKAVEAKSMGNLLLAEELWTQVLLIPGSGDEEARKKLRFEKQLASRGLKGLATEEAAPPAPAVQVPAPEPESKPDPVVSNPEFDTLPPVKPVAADPVFEIPPPAEPPAMDPLVRAKSDAEGLPAPAPVAGNDLDDFFGEPAENAPKDDLPAPAPVADNDLDDFFGEPAENAPKDDLDDLFGESAEVDVPAAATPQAEREVEEQYFEDEEQYFDDPAEPEVVTAPPKKPRSKLPLYIGAAALVVLVLVAGIWLLIDKKKKDYQAAATAAFEAADQIETRSDFPAARVAWQQVAADFPDFQHGEGMVTPQTRLGALDIKIEDRKNKVIEYLTNARDYIRDGLLIDETEENALYYINRVREIDPKNTDLAEMLESVRTNEFERAQALVAEGKIPEAKLVYDALREVDPEFRDEALEAGMREWLVTKVVTPGMKQLENDVKRKRWEKALKFSEELRPQMPDESVLDRYWDNVMVDYQTIYDEAKLKQQETKMLAALQVMIQIRPNEDLVARRDKLSSDLNKDKITNLENRVRSALKDKKFQQAANRSNELLRLNSSNSVAKNALDEIRFRKKEEITQVKGRNPRLALVKYDELLKISNWKSYRDERDVIKLRVTEFDKAVASVKRLSSQSLSQQKERVDQVLGSFPEFVDDANFAQLQNASEKMAEEDTRLREMVRWEARAENDPGKTYASILKTLKSDARFRFSYDYAKKKSNALKSKYQERIDDYDGNVTLVVKSGQNLPKLKGRKPQGYCQLTIGDETFKTENEPLPAPAWNHSFQFEAEPGTPLVFMVFQKVKRTYKSIGTVQLAKVPQNQNNLVLKSADGKWSITVDIRRER